MYRTTALTDVEGRAVGYASFDTRGPILDATFAGNRVSRLVSARGGEALVASWQSRSGDKAVPSEFVIGTNPALPAVLPSGFMPYYGYGAGIVRCRSATTGSPEARIASRVTWRPCSSFPRPPSSPMAW